jgi:hypothetical protein
MNNSIVIPKECVMTYNIIYLFTWMFASYRSAAGIKILRKTSDITIPFAKVFRRSK